MIPLQFRDDRAITPLDLHVDIGNAALEHASPQIGLADQDAPPGRICPYRTPVFITKIPKDEEAGTMKIIVLAQRNAEVSMEQMRPHFKAEVEAVWELYTRGIVREF